MRIGSPPDYPKIPLTELSRLTLDEESAHHFERRFQPPGFAVLAAGFGLPVTAWLLSRFGLLSGVTAAISGTAGILLAFVLGIWTHHRMIRVRPHSVRTGNEMRPFVITGLPFPNQYEIAYIDESSGTYFRRLYFD